MVIMFVFNMSVGVNLCFKLFEFVVCVLGDEVDIEVLEFYYCYKVDLFFGMVLWMGEVVVEMLGCDFNKVVVYGCEG